MSMNDIGLFLCTYKVLEPPRKTRGAQHLHSHSFRHQQPRLPASTTPANGALTTRRPWRSSDHHQTCGGLSMRQRRKGQHSADFQLPPVLEMRCKYLCPQ
jgi:hypothetical protein